MIGLIEVGKVNSYLLSIGVSMSNRLDIANWTAYGKYHLKGKEEAAFYYTDYSLAKTLAKFLNYSPTDIEEFVCSVGLDLQFEPREMIPSDQK